jgi:hypothetical protein
MRQAGAKRIDTDGINFVQVTVVSQSWWTRFFWSGDDFKRGAIESAALDQHAEVVDLGDGWFAIGTRT